MPTIAAVTWSAIDDHGPMVLWLVWHLVNSIIVGLTFYLPFRRDDLKRFPRSTIASISYALVVVSCLIFAVAPHRDDLIVVYGVAAVLFGLAAGAAITMGTIPVLGRLTQVALIGPLIIGTSFYGHWVVAAASLYFLVVVAWRGISAMTTWGNELAQLRFEAAKRERDARHAASHDALTGLLNRQGLARMAAQRSGGETCGLFIDLDGFKEVNDTLGHLAGDEVLAMIGKRIRSHFRTTDALARLGGDEFFVLTTNMAAADVIARAEELIVVLSRPFGIGGARRSVSASVGFASALPNEPLDDLIGRADRALYRAKRAGRSQVVVAADADAA